MAIILLILKPFKVFLLFIMARQRGGEAAQPPVSSVWFNSNPTLQQPEANFQPPHAKQQQHQPQQPKANFSYQA
jgi:hypothetical protein